jgi:PKD repeat protein
MTIPSTTGEELLLSRSSNEQLSRSIIAKDSLRTVSRAPHRLNIVEYGTTDVFRLDIAADIFHLTSAFDNSGNLLPDRFWLFRLFNKELYFSEVEPFSSAQPVFNFTRLLHSNSLGFSCCVNPNDVIRVSVIEDTVPVSLVVLKYNNVDDLTPETTIIDWSDDRDPLSLTNFIDPEATQFDVGFTKPGSPFNLFIESYAIPAPTNLSLQQVVGDLAVEISWDGSIEEDNYVLQRATDSEFTSDLVTVYDGPLLTVLDSTPQPNTYYYRILAKLSSLSINSYWTTAYINIHPVAKFSADVFSGNANLTVQFTDESLGEPTSWLWNFGDSSTSTDQNPEHTYTKAGTFTVSLTINGGAASETKTDYITVYLVAQFSGTPTSGAAPLEVQFTDVSLGTPTLWLWEFGDTTTSSLQNPLHTYTDIGDFTVKLTVSVTSSSASETKSSYIHVSAFPIVADFTASPTDDEFPLVVNFTDTSTCSHPITDWYWVFGDGKFSNEQNPIHTYNTPGDYTVSLTVTDSYSFQDTETKTDYIKVGEIDLVVNFVGVPREGESPLVVDFTNLTEVPDGHAVLGWEWSFGDGETSTEMNPTHVYLRDGYFTVTLRAFIKI